MIIVISQKYKCFDSRRIKLSKTVKNPKYAKNISFIKYLKGNYTANNQLVILIYSLLIFVNELQLYRHIFSIYSFKPGDRITRMSIKKNSMFVE